MTQQSDPAHAAPASRTIPPIDKDPFDWGLPAMGLLIVMGWVATAVILSNDKHPSPPSVDYPGLSPAIRACYLFHTKASPIIIAFAVGVCLGISYIFGTFLYKKFRDTSANERRMFWEAVSDNLKGNQTSELRELMGAFREYEHVILDKRNLYWSLFTRTTLAILVVGLIALLISTCKIESQAGLPIISGIIAFIIGQSAELVHSAGSPTIHVSSDRTAPRADPDGAQADQSRQAEQSPPRQM